MKNELTCTKLEKNKTNDMYYIVTIMHIASPQYLHRGMLQVLILAWKPSSKSLRRAKKHFNTFTVGLGAKTSSKTHKIPRNSRGLEASPNSHACRSCFSASNHSPDWRKIRVGHGCKAGTNKVRIFDRKPWRNTT